jgi:nucleotide-binding universal stress UspA family protein
MVHKRILVWLNDSSTSVKALREAICLAKEYGAQLDTLTVETAPHYPGAVGEVVEATEASTRKYDKLAETAQEVAKQSDFNLRSHLAFGSKAKTFKEFIEKNGVDLLVLGYAGRSALYERTIGSTFQSLVRLAPCAVLVVK